MCAFTGRTRWMPDTPAATAAAVCGAGRTAWNVCSARATTPGAISTTISTATPSTTPSGSRRRCVTGWDDAWPAGPPARPALRRVQQAGRRAHDGAVHPAHHEHRLRRRRIDPGAVHLRRGEHLPAAVVGRGRSPIRCTGGRRPGRAAGDVRALGGRRHPCRGDLERRKCGPERRRPGQELGRQAVVDRTMPTEWHASLPLHDLRPAGSHWSRRRRLAGCRDQGDRRQRLRTGPAHRHLPPRRLTASGHQPAGGMLPAMSFTRVAVLGLGKVGWLAASLLREAGFEVVGLDLGAAASLRAELAHVDAVLSCLPYALNAEIAEAAHADGIHYFDLTEDVPTTRRIMELSATSAGVMAPQCGLAPGFVCIVAADYAERFERCRSIRMRVGALPQHPTGLLGYAFNWSPEGVVNEYLNDAEVIEEGERKFVSSMEWKETIHVNGNALEAFTTSGGLGTMCETFHGRVDNLDYKTIRYPGHMDLMNFFFHELLMRQRRDLAGEILTNAKPPVDEDVVYVHVACEGTIGGRMRRLEFVRAYYPREIAGMRSTAIA